MLDQPNEACMAQMNIYILYFAHFTCFFKVQSDCFFVLVCLQYLFSYAALSVFNVVQVPVSLVTKQQMQLTELFVDRFAFLALICVVSEGELPYLQPVHVYK